MRRSVIQAGHDLEARQHALGHADRRRRDVSEQPVDPNSHLQRVAEGLDVQIGGALLDRDPKQIVDRAHHRSSAREIAQIIQIVLRGRRVGGRRGARFLTVQHGGERRVDVVAGRHREGDRSAQRQLHRADRFAFGRYRDRERKRSGSIFERKQPALPQKTRRHLLAGEPATHQIGTLRPVAAVEGRQLVREGRLRQLGEAEPIHLGGRATTRRAARDRGLAQDTLAGEMIDEIARDHG
jgi:hypothetical protein